MSAATAKPYRKLPGRGASGFTVCRLWLGEDHLLLVQSSSVGERYKRFYFADIQAFVLRRTAAYVIWAIVWLFLAALCLAIALNTEPPGRWIVLGIAGVFLVVLGVHLALGPTCSCHVRTAVQSEELSSLRRLRTTRRVIAQVRPLIEQSQSASAPEPA